MGFLHVLLWCSKTYSFIKTFIQFWENFYLKKFIQLLYNIICEIMFFFVVACFRLKLEILTE